MPTLRIELVKIMIKITTFTFCERCRLVAESAEDVPLPMHSWKLN